MYHVPFEQYDWPAEPVQIDVDDVRLAHNYAHNKRDVRKYASLYKKGKQPLAVVLGERPDGSWCVLDGAHRIEAAQRAGMPTLLAYIGKELPFG